MKRNRGWVVAVAVAGILGWGIGRFTGPGFAIRVEVDDSGTRLVSTRGCRWQDASYGGESSTYAFEVTDKGVRTLGPLPRGR